MDRIIRIHIAKVPYTIEAQAEVRLKQYLHDIRSNLDSDTVGEVMDDIEARVPELLLVRRVKANDVITVDDVQYVQKHLGDPEQFLSDESPKRGESQPKILFRDMDRGLIGGVAAGLSRRLGLNVYLIRYAFLIACIFFGSGAIAYGLLWLVLPEAKTGTDKLLMSGQPVTAAALQQYRAQDETVPRRGPRLIQRLTVKTARLVSLGMTALLALVLLVVFGAISGLFYIAPFRSIVSGFGEDYLLVGLMWLGCLCFIGLLIMLTVRIWGYRSPRLNLSALILLAVFIMATAGVSTTGVLVYNHFSDKYGGTQALRPIAVTPETGTGTPSTLVVNSDSNLQLSYFVSDQPLHASYEMYPGMNRPNVTVSDKKGVITVNSEQLDQVAPSCLGGLCRKIYLPIKVLLYGPALSQFQNLSGATLGIMNMPMVSMLAINSQNGSSTTIFNSNVGAVAIAASNGSSVAAQNTTAQSVSITTDSTSNVMSPVTDSLSANVPASCLAGNTPSLISLISIPSHLMVNGQSATAVTVGDNGCIMTNN